MVDGGFFKLFPTLIQLLALELTARADADADDAGQNVKMCHRNTPFGHWTPVFSRSRGLIEEILSQRRSTIRLVDKEWMCKESWTFCFCSFSLLVWLGFERISLFLFYNQLREASYLQEVKIKKKKSFHKRPLPPRNTDYIPLKERECFQDFLIKVKNTG